MDDIKLEQQDQQPGYFAIIPALIRYDEDLQPNAKLLYGELTCLMNLYGFCFAKNEYFARLYDVSNETVSRWISKLSDKKYIVVFSKNVSGEYTRIVYLPGTDLVEIKNRLDKKIKVGLDKKIKVGLDKKIKVYSNIINSIITSSNNKRVVDLDKSTISDNDIDSGSDNKKLPEEIKCKFFDYWNTKENLRHHKLNSKVHKRASELFKLYSMGLFGKMYDLSEKYMSDNKISKDDLNRKYSDDEIFEAIDRFDRMHLPEYGDQTGYPIDCDKFLYNSITGSSFFLSKVGEGKDPVPRHEKCLDENVEKLYREAFFKRNLNGAEIAGLCRGVNYVIRKRNEYFTKFEECKIGISTRMLDLGFYKLHISFIREKYQDSGRLSIDTLKRKDIWEEYVRWLRSVHKINLLPNKDEIEKAKIIFNNVHQIREENESNDEAERKAWEKKRSAPCSEGIRSRYQLSAMEGK